MPHTATAFTYLPPDRGFPIFLEDRNTVINCPKLSDLDDRVNEYWNAAEITLSFDIDVTAAPGKVDYDNSSVNGYDSLKYFVTRTTGPAVEPSKPLVEEGECRVPPNKIAISPDWPNLKTDKMRIEYEGTSSRITNSGLFIFKDGLYYSITISKAPEFLITSDANVAQYMVTNEGGASSGFDITWAGKSGNKTFRWYLVAQNKWEFTVNSATMTVEYFQY